MFQEEQIHNQTNFELSSKLNNNNFNVLVFKNERLQRIKPRQKGMQALSKTQVEIIDYHRQGTKQTRIDNKSDLDLSTYNQTNNITNIKSGTKNIKDRALTTANPGQRNFRTSDKKRLKGQVGKSMNITPKKQNQNLFLIRNSYEELEKKNNKGPLEVKCMENWLNDILIEYCYEEKFDSTIKNPALKKFQIDRNSLLSKGIGHEKINRIYRSIFVYSIGFNKLLEELSTCQEPIAIRKTIWKVYAMLLQFCAKGEFQTMVGQIERDKLRKIQQMKDEIQKRQKIIDASEELDKERNIKIYKEIKLLKQQNQVLQNQKAIIEQDFKQADQAFNEEVGLRLKFEHKINEIHGIHRELGIKHLRLYEDFNAYKIEYNKVVEQRKKQSARVEQLKLELLKAEETIEKLTRDNEQKKTFLENYDYKLEICNKRIKQLEFKLQHQFSSEKSKERELNLLRFEVDNGQGIISLKQKALNDQVRQVQVLIEQNRSMFSKMEQQKCRIQQLCKIQYEFELTTLNVKTSYEILESKYQSKLNYIDKQKQEIKEQKQRMIELQAEYNLSVQKNKMLANDLVQYNDNLELMKKAKNALQDQLNNHRQRNAMLEGLINSKQTIEGQLNIRLGEAMSEVIKLKTELSDLEAKLKFNVDSFTHEKNLLTKKHDKMKIQRDELRRIDDERKQIMIMMQAENEKCKREEHDAKTKLRDQIFQRNNLQLKYTQSLMVMEDQNKYIKQLNINMSHLKEQTEATKRQLKSVEFVLMEKSEQFKRDMNMMNGQIETLKLQIERKRGWIHPMLYWDLEATVQQMKHKGIETKQQYSKLQGKIKQNQDEYSRKLKEVVDGNEVERKKYQEQVDKNLNLMDRQLKFYKQKCEEQNMKIVNLDISVRKYQAYLNEGQNPKQKALIKTVKQKQEQVNKYKSQNQALQGRNSELNRNLILGTNQIQQLKKLLNKQQEAITRYEQDLKHSQESRMDLQKQLINLENDYNQLKIGQEDLSKEKIEKKSKASKTKNLSDKHSRKETSQSNSQREQTRKKTEEKVSKNLRISQNQFKANTINNNSVTNQGDTAGLIERQQKEKNSRFIQDDKRKEIVRKIHGAFNYYNHVKK